MTTFDDDERADELREWIAQDEQEPTPADIHRGQARIAYRLANRYRGRMLHVTGIGWHAWDGTRFVPDERGETTRNVLTELRCALAESLDDKDLRADVRKCESASGVSGVLSIAAALEPFAATVPDLDADPYLLNAANGTLDLRTGELRSHSPSDAITKICRGAHTDSRSQLWESFLERVLPDESVRGYLQRLIGLSLLGAVRENVLTFLTGTGANGKTVFDTAIRHALGDYAIVGERDLFMARESAHPTGELDLRGVRLVVVSESDKGRRLAEANMKRLSGGDTIRARRMRQDFVEFTPSHTAVLITNFLPLVSGDDPAIWRRIRVVPFAVTIPDDEQDPELGERLELDADAILSWAIQGWKDYCERGLDEPAAVIAATDRYQHDSDAVARFIAECCVVAPAVKATTGQLFDAWEKWRITDGADQMSLKAFGNAITMKGYPAPVKSVNGKKFREGIAVSTVGDGGDGDE